MSKCVNYYLCIFIKTIYWLHVPNTRRLKKQLAKKVLKKLTNFPSKLHAKEMKQSLDK
jgi:hypothetical protein